MYCVYWIRLEEHTDPLVQGYIGITSNLKERIRAHRKNKRKTVLTSVAKKYGWENLITESLYENLDQLAALSIEQTLRPTMRIGWNCQRGGELGVESSWYNDLDNRQRHSVATSNATKAGILKKDTHERRAARAKQSWENNRESYKDISKGSNNSRAILNEEQVRAIKYELNSLPVKQLANMFSVGYHVIYQIRSGKNWSHI